MFGVLLSPSLLKDRRTNSDTDNKDYGASGLYMALDCQKCFLDSSSLVDEFITKEV